MRLDSRLNTWDFNLNGKKILAVLKKNEHKFKFYVDEVFFFETTEKKGEEIISFLEVVNNIDQLTDLSIQVFNTSVTRLDLPPEDYKAEDLEIDSITHEWLNPGRKLINEIEDKAKELVFFKTRSVKDGVTLPPGDQY